MWYNEAIIYQIYPLGLCGVAGQNNCVEPAVPGPIRQVEHWLAHLQALGVTTILFNPLFDSDAHGYDTRDFARLDPRLGTEKDLVELCRAIKKAGFHLLFDGVFNHVGRGFGAFKDVREKRERSAYKDWFLLNFSGDSNYGDGFWYEGWEGHFDLVKLNLKNPQVTAYLLDQVDRWRRDYGIDGLRLDVAYTLDRDFLSSLRLHCDKIAPDFFLTGEMIHGNYNEIVNDRGCHSATNYECAKGLLSAFNSRNLFEIAHSLQRQFNDEPWALYKGCNTLLSFVDNHDISRAASVVTDPCYLPLIYALMFTMPGIPTLYYGSEWGAEGDKNQGDGALRPAFSAPQHNELTEQISRLCAIRRERRALAYGDFKVLHLNNEQLIFQRRVAGERLMTAINMADCPRRIDFDAGCGRAENLLTGQWRDFGGGIELPACSAEIWLAEN